MPYLGGSGKLWEALGSSGKLWEALGSSGGIWEALGGSGKLWQVLAGSGNLLEAQFIFCFEKIISSVTLTKNLYFSEAKAKDKDKAETKS